MFELSVETGRGVPARLESSSPPTTNSGSNSAGSGPFPGGGVPRAELLCLGLWGRLLGEMFREPWRRIEELDRE